MLAIDPRSLTVAEIIAARERVRDEIIDLHQKLSERKATMTRVGALGSKQYLNWRTKNVHKLHDLEQELRALKSLYVERTQDGRTVAERREDARQERLATQAKRVEVRQHLAGVVNERDSIELLAALYKTARVFAEERDWLIAPEHRATIELAENLLRCPTCSQNALESGPCWHCGQVREWGGW